MGILSAMGIFQQLSDTTAIGDDESAQQNAPLPSPFPGLAMA
jgi:hypothetical protein